MGFERSVEKSGQKRERPERVSSKGETDSSLANSDNGMADVPKRGASRGGDRSPVREDVSDGLLGSSKPSEKNFQKGNFELVGTPPPKVPNTMRGG